MTTLGAPLTVFREVSLCDRREHEVAIATDGQRAYVYPVEGNTVHEPVVSRTGVTLTAACPAVMGEAEAECDGYVTWRLDGEHGWGADADAQRLLVAYGTGVE